MLNFPIISIVTPSFNQEKYLKKTIDSVISQEGDFFIDYLIMDAGSTDGSKDIIMEYEGIIRSQECHLGCKGIQYRWVSEQDRGQSNAINKGWNHAKGDIITWINSDDYFAPGAFSKAVEAFGIDQSILMIYGDLNIIDENGHLVFYKKLNEFEYLSLLCQRMGISQPGSFLRREVTNLIGYLDEDLDYVMDLEYWLRLSLVGVIKYIPFDFAYYRVHAKAKSSSSPKLWQREMLRMLKKHFKSNKKLTFGDKLRALAETYRHTARFFLPFRDRYALLRSCLLASILYPPLLWASDLYGYWLYAIFGFGVGDYLKKRKRAVLGDYSSGYLK
jgi:glycosyltransferase involved in cell wall biosynthesis